MSCPECHRTSLHKMDCSRGRTLEQPFEMSQEQIAGVAWVAAQNAGWRCYLGYKRERWEERECVAGAVAAGIGEYNRVVQDIAERQAGAR